jgi:hypothetical protein
MGNCKTQLFKFMGCFGLVATLNELGSHLNMCCKRAWNCTSSETQSIQGFIFIHCANMQEELRCASLPKHKSFQNNKKVPASAIKVANSMIVNQLYTCSTPTK